MRRSFFVVLLAVSVSLFAVGSNAQATDAGSEIASLKNTGRAFASIAKKTMPGVVFIRVEKYVATRGTVQRNDPFDLFGDDFRRRFFGKQYYGRQPQKYKQEGQGSGFLISKDGYILTNNHVVGDADKITVRLSDKREFEAKLVGTDPKSEVAVIKIDADNLPFLEIGDSDKLEIGEWVIAVGNPFGLSETLTVGVVSAKGRNNIGIADYENFIQTDAAINPGNSGGPLLNIDGKVIGINTAIFSESGGYMGIGFAIPMHMASVIKDQLINNNGQVQRGYMGIEITDVTDDLSEQFGLDKSKGGILVNEVMPDSAAEKAGLKYGDIILQVNGVTPADTASFRNEVASCPPQTAFKLTIFRDKKIIEKTVVTALLDGGNGPVAGAKELFDKLGMTLHNLTDDIASRFGYEVGDGVIVSEVEMGSQAARIGFQPGILVTSVGQKKVSNLKEFMEAVNSTKQNGKILLRIRSERFARYITMSVE